MQEPSPSTTTYNAAMGLAYRKYFRGKLQYFQVSCLLAGYTNTRVEEVPFEQGWGVYPYLQVKAFGTLLEMGFWRSGSFVPVLGSPHFGNVSTNFDGLLFDAMNVLHAQATYECKKYKFSTIQIETGIYYYLPYTGDRPNYSKVIRGSATSFDFGIHFYINPEFKLKL